MPWASCWPVVRNAKGGFRVSLTVRWLGQIGPDEEGALQASNDMWYGLVLTGRLALRSVNIIPKGRSFPLKPPI